MYRLPEICQWGAVHVGGPQYEKPLCLPLNFSLTLKLLEKINYALKRGCPKAVRTAEGAPHPRALLWRRSLEGGAQRSGAALEIHLRPLNLSQPRAERLAQPLPPLLGDMFTKHHTSLHGVDVITYESIRWSFTSCKTKVASHAPTCLPWA